MNCTCKVEQRRLTPGVFNLKQFLNGSETMVWEVDNCVINQGTCDLKNYDAFLTLCVGGEIDEILLTKRQSGDKLQLIWDVGTYATALTGYVKYQICFRSANFDTLGVIADDPEAHGVYPLTDNNATGNDRIFQKADNDYSIKWDAANGRWALYQADGVTVVDFQTTPSTEPHCGIWGNVAVGNNEAAAWISDEAIMYISDSIAADQTITGGFPTILRQLWAKVVKAAGVISVNGKTGIVELSASDIGAAEEQHAHQIKDTEGLQEALNGKSETGHKHTTADVTDLQAELNKKAAASHAHKIADTEGLQSTLDSKSPTGHDHAISNVTGLQDALNGKFPISGGTITGEVLFMNTAAFGALTSEEGGELVLNGAPGYTSTKIDNYKGTSRIFPTGGVGIFQIDHANKAIYFDGKDITLGYPNYSAAVALGKRSSYTATANGWIYVYRHVDQYVWECRVNGIRVYVGGGTQHDHSATFLPVKKGDVITVYGEAGITDNADEWVFCPNR